jgi:aryl carrier-like protein
MRPEALAAVETMRQEGVQVNVLPVDITRASSIRQALTQIDSSMPKLIGVLHTAMVLEDKLLVDLDLATLQRVLWPKVLGGWNLHRETRDRPLDMFVLFSSLSSVFGHAGQANYSAANALLDSLAHHRRSQGLPGLVINWGHLGQVGYLAQREQLGQRLERQGVLSFTVAQATDCLEYALQTLTTQMSVLRIDWSVWRGLGLTGRISPKFAHLLRHTEGPVDENGELSAVDNIRSASGGQRLQLIGRQMRGKIGSLLGLAADQIRDERALLEMGLDSLMAVELRNWIEGYLQVSLPISALMRSQSLTALVQQISQTMADQTGSGRSDSSQAAPTTPQTPAVPAISSQQAADLLDNLDQLGDDQVSQLLKQFMQ